MDPRSGTSSRRSSVAPQPPSKETIPVSAASNLALAGTTINFSLPSESVPRHQFPLSADDRNHLFFTRGARIYSKPIVGDDGAVQLTRVSAKDGFTTAIECAGADRPASVAVATSGGIIRIWDAASSASVVSFKVKEPHAIKWCGPLLLVGGGAGVRAFDTRITPLKGKTVFSAKGHITAVSWSKKGNLIASGKANGVVDVWDVRTRTVLEADEPCTGSAKRGICHDGPVRVRRPHIYSSATYYLMLRLGA